MLLALFSFFFGEINFTSILERLCYGLKNIVHTLPTSFGGYEGSNNVEICFLLTKVPVSHWNSNLDVCEELINDNIKSKVVLILAAYGLLLLFVVLIYVPYKLLTGSNDLIYSFLKKMIGLESGDKHIVIEINKKPIKTEEDKDKDKAKAMKANETKQRNKNNELIAGWFISFLVYVNSHKMTMKEMHNQIAHYKLQIENILGDTRLLND